MSNFLILRLLALLILYASYSGELEASDLGILLGSHPGLNLEEMKNSKVRAIVFIGYLEACPILKRYNPVLTKMKIKYGKDIRFLLFDPANISRLPAETKSVASEQTQPRMPVVYDVDGRLNHYLKLKTASQVSVIETKNYSQIYLGAIDDRLTLDFERPQPKNNFLEDVLSSVLKGQSPKFQETDAFGCILNVVENKN